MEKLAALSVDLDEIGCYTSIHGLPAGDDASAGAVYRHAVPRFERLFDDEGIRATFFVIGRDLARDEAALAVRRLHRGGHEIGNHTLSHHYDFSRRGKLVMRHEVSGGAKAIEAVTGERPTGFRAPGYTMTDDAFEILEAEKVAYDSSVFPCPAYYGAKTSMISWLAFRRRPTHSIVDDVRVLSAPANPYRVGRPYWSRGKGLLELPIGVTNDLSGRLPYIGTSVVLAGDAGARALTMAVRGRPLVNLELHGIDLSDAKRDGLEWLAPHQPDLRKTADQKESALRAAIRSLRDGGYRFVTLAEAARSFAM